MQSPLCYPMAPSRDRALPKSSYSGYLRITANSLPRKLFLQRSPMLRRGAQQSIHPFKTAAIPSLAIPPAYGIAPLCREPTSFSSNLWSSFKVTNRRGLKSGTAKLRVISALQRDSGSIRSGERREVVLKVGALLLSF